MHCGAERTRERRTVALPSRSAVTPIRFPEAYMPKKTGVAFPVHPYRPTLTLFRMGSSRAVFPAALG